MTDLPDARAEAPHCADSSQVWLSANPQDRQLPEEDSEWSKKQRDDTIFSIVGEIGTLAKVIGEPAGMANHCFCTLTLVFPVVRGIGE